MPAELRPPRPGSPRGPGGPGGPLGPLGPAAPDGPSAPSHPGIPSHPFRPGVPVRPGRPGRPCTWKQNEKNTSTLCDIIMHKVCIRVENLDPDSVGSEDPDQNPTSVAGFRKLLIELEKTKILGLGFSKNSWTLVSGSFEGWCYMLVLEFKNC
jgi:hypothetical protein